MLGQDGRTMDVVDTTTNYVVATGVPADRASSVQQQFESGAGGNIALFANSIPASRAFDALVAPSPNKDDIIYHELYDGGALTTTVANNPTLFLQPAVGNIFNSNMPGNGRLNNDQRFFMIGIRWELENNDATNPLDIVDVKECFRLGTYQFWVGEKIYNSQYL